jgi:hypothetical protein
MACAIDLVTVDVLIMPPPNTWASLTYERLSGDLAPAGQPPKDRPLRVPVLIIDKMVRMIYC